jgi:hypothetical protein
MGGLKSHHPNEDDAETSPLDLPFTMFRPAQNLS